MNLQLSRERKKNFKVIKKLFRDRICLKTLKNREDKKFKIDLKCFGREP